MCLVFENKADDSVASPRNLKMPRMWTLYWGNPQIEENHTKRAATCTTISHVISGEPSKSFGTYILSQFVPGGGQGATEFNVFPSGFYSCSFTNLYHPILLSEMELFPPCHLCWKCSHFIWILYRGPQPWVQEKTLDMDFVAVLELLRFW